MKIGFVGLGRMGGALARRLMREHRLSVFDLRPEVRQAFAQEGAEAMASPVALAKECDLVLTCLPTSAEVRDVICGADGLAAGLKKGSLIADMTTGDPNATRQMAEMLRAREIELIDAPVSGGPHGAVAGTIAIIVGSTEAQFARMRPVFATISPNIFHTGGVGTGQIMKLVNNVIAAGVRAATFEGVALGVKNGLDLKTCVDILQKGTARSYTTELALPGLLDPNRKMTFSLGLMHKDVRLATDVAAQSGVPMPLASAVREVFLTAINELGYETDLNDLIRVCERQARVAIVPA
ncbi:MAG: NAD(P)-dependent oxidoreductase [Alphaproteobacteria bacterium]|nr:NAD(P)-dependent oxidoreductase [Alphaproteobacteria bacterium]